MKIWGEKSHVKSLRGQFLRNGNQRSLAFFFSKIYLLARPGHVLLRPSNLDPIRPRPRVCVCASGQMSRGMGSNLINRDKPSFFWEGECPSPVRLEIPVVNITSAPCFHTQHTCAHPCDDQWTVAYSTADESRDAFRRYVPGARWGLAQAFDCI
jgi:hypothetical protein